MPTTSTPSVETESSRPSPAPGTGTIRSPRKPGVSVRAPPLQTATLGIRPHSTAGKPLQCLLLGRRRKGTTMFTLWLRRAAAYILRIVLPASLLSQLIGTLLFGKSSPGGAAETWIGCASLLVAGVISALSTRNGQSWAHQLLRLQVLDQESGAPISALRMGLRELAHLADFASLCIGFLWPLWDSQRQTFADKIVSTVVVSVDRPQ